MERRLIKDVIRGSAIYVYHIMHLEDEFITNMIYEKCDTAEKVIKMCYLRLFKQGYQDTILEMIPNILNDEMRILAHIAIKENNKEIIESLYKNGLTYNFNMYKQREGCFKSIQCYAFTKQGFEMIKFMNELGVDLNIMLFTQMIHHKHWEAINYFIETTNKPLPELFLSSLSLSSEEDIQSIFDLFIDKIDMSKYEDNIFKNLTRVSPNVMKIVLQSGITIQSNKPLLYACQANNLKLAEFYLQYGLQVDEDLLDTLFRNAFAYNKDILLLFIKYEVDLSVYKPDLDRKFISDLDKCGLDRDALYLLLRSHNN